MGSRDVHLYAYDLYKFLLPRKRYSIDEENIPPPRDEGADSESQFSDVVGRAILILCHKNRHNYLTRFVQIEKFLLRSIESFVTVLAMYAQFMHSNCSRLVDSLLQFSALLLELIAFAADHGHEDYIAFFPVLWEMTLSKLYCDRLPDNLNSRAEEFADMHCSERDAAVPFEPEDGFLRNKESVPNFEREYEGKTSLTTAGVWDAMAEVETDHSKRHSELELPKNNINEHKEFTIQEYEKTGAIPKNIIRPLPANSKKDTPESAKETSNFAELEKNAVQNYYSREGFEKSFGFYENIYNEFKLLAKNLEFDNPEFKKRLKKLLNVNLDYCEKLRLLFKL